MSKKTISLAILALIFIFPFRWVYLEYPDPIYSQGTLIDAGRIEYVFYFLLCVAGFLTFMFMSTTDTTDNKSETIKQLNSETIKPLNSVIRDDGSEQDFKIPLGVAVHH